MSTPAATVVGERSEMTGEGAYVVLPTYQERDNLRAMVTAIHAALPDAHLLIVDDNSPDGTGELGDAIAGADPRVTVLHRAYKEGLGAAYRAGFRYVLGDPGARHIIQMDCDFSHDPADLPRLIQQLARGADLVIGSRYVRGGDTPGWGLRRRILSRGGSLFARTVLGMPVHDLTGGFKAWRSSLLGTIDLEAGYANGYGFQIEMSWRARHANARIVEVPIVFRDRVVGYSKMNGGIVREAFLVVVRLRFSRAVSRAPATHPGPS